MASTSTPGHGIGTRTVRGMFWASGAYFFVRLTTLAATVVLARLLAPGDFGLVALATTFTAFLDMLQGLGVGEALVISTPDDLEGEADTAFAVSSTVGVLLWLAASALGPVAASFFHQPKLVALMPALGLTFLVYGVGSTHYNLAMRSIDFRSRTLAQVGDAVVRGVVGISLALAGAGVWSLVAGYVAGRCTMTIILWRLVPWRPRFHPERKYLRRLLTFGGSLTGVGIMGALLAQFDNGVVGRVLGATQLGFYSIANRLPSLLIISLAAAAGQVLFPAFATLEGEAMRRGLWRSLRYTAMLVLPLTAALITLAEPLTVGLFGSRWRPAIAAMQVMSLWALMSPVSMVCGYAFMSRGRADLILRLSVPQAAVLIVGSLLLVRKGIVAVAWLQAGIAIVTQIVTLGIMRRKFGLLLRDVITAVGPPVIASAAVAGCFVLIYGVISDPWPTLAIAGLVGTVVYLGLLHVLAPNMLPELHALAFPSSARPGGWARLRWRSSRKPPGGR